ncbi:sigma 54-interacting transcriptional regulator [Neorhizobium galegae]|uniref:Sigma-54 interacting regulator,V4R domain-containing protein n=1 Tax=Neorhizobium galegae bv. officinalis TaxID=323656 RepID=A0A0T7H234_NEOGA|nr:sigma-54-dependent Fis family transcriptional regulator [Neorhizobium galegae]MCQ1781298.1 sigma 54-interacting transcriptional regulator [Neorhizobium galegae]MCQ1799605.1 sigma 54-interacting transcriptional regulator [Neorhizobium galegae]CDZ40674.1 Sigma-54 interacting regulator,V4R domain-containing protein [Neorhizobium galegae bv. officinalis]CDZ53586.1 Sigma-54 interacting regulator,V4R domain-containing protein [Neorhizobium galegae bv. officinalis]
MDRLPKLISLADASRKTGKMVSRGAFDELDTGASPTLSELAQALHFSLGDGRIWLNDQRMLLMQAQVLGRLRQEVIEAFGVEAAKGMFMRVGYMQGVRDAELIQKRFPNEDLTHALAAGPRVHTLEGFVKVTTRHFRFDVMKGTYFGEFLWEDSSEAAEHIAHHGLATEPVCWMQTGYPTGYTSKLFKRPVIFREIECSAMGAQRCLVVGQNAEEWGNDAPERAYFGLEWKPRRRETMGDATPEENGDKDGSREPTASKTTDEIIGVSASFLRARAMVEKVADTDATVLLIGESGVGKELFSQKLHRLSPRSKGPFVAINCAAIPDNLVESELFGVEKGAFTGAVASRAGYFERAASGTIFLDEIASLAYAAQGKLLRAIQERQIERVGGSRTVPANVRVIAASNVELADEVRAGRFRQDLYFRLCVFPIAIPPLRERRDDISFLVSHFLRQFNIRHRRDCSGLTHRAMDALLAYDFPGNIRELQNMIERGVIFADAGAQIDIQHLFSGREMSRVYPQQLSEDGRIWLPAPRKHAANTALGVGITSTDDLVKAEEALYRAALADAGGNISSAARRLGLTRAKLDYRLKKHGLAGAR